MGDTTGGAVIVVAMPISSTGRDAAILIATTDTVPAAIRFETLIACNVIDAAVAVSKPIIGVSAVMDNATSVN